MQSDNKEKDFSEKDLAKVLPSEGGRVYIFSQNRVATLTYIDLKKNQATAKIGDSEGNKEVFKVQFDDICKIN